MNFGQTYFENSASRNIFAYLSVIFQAMYRRYIIKILILLPILVYFIFVINFSKNIPFMDDYMLFGFIGDFINEDSLTKKIQLIFMEHNDHRVVFLKLVALVQYMITGALNFQYLIFLGNVQIIALLYILWGSMGDQIKKLHYFLPAVYLLFGFSYFEASIWAMVSLSGLSVIIFSMLTIYFSGKDGAAHFIGACIFATASVFAQGNGKIVLFCCLAIYLYKRQHRKSMIWILLSIILLVMPSVIFGTTHTGYVSLLEILQSPIKYVRHYLSVFSFLGAYFESFTFYGTYFGWPRYLSSYFGNIILTIIAGGLVLAYYLYLIRIRYYNKNIILFGMLTFIVLTALGVGYARPSVVFPSRYAIYSTIAFILIYLTMVDLSKSGFSRFIVACSASVIFFGTIYQYHIAPLKIKYYVITVIDYERNLVMNEYSENNMNRAKVNQMLVSDLKQIGEDMLVRTLSTLSIKSFIDSSEIKTKQIMTQKSEWFNEYIPLFSRELGVAEKLKIYTRNNM